MVKNQSGYVESLGQRRWTTDGKTFVTEQNLDALVERLSNKQGVRVKERSSEDIVFRYIGFLTKKGSKEGVPVFVNQNMNGYLGLPVEGIKPGELYAGTVENITPDTRNLGLIAKIAGNREMRIDGGGPPKIVRYNVKSETNKTNLEEALKFRQIEHGKYNVPVYRGPILEFVKEWGPFKKSKPLKDENNGSSEMNIVGAIVIDKEDYWPLSDHFPNMKTLNSLENYVISQYPQGYGILVEKGRLNNVILGDYPKEMLQGIPENRGFLDYLVLQPSSPPEVESIPASIMNSISSDLDSIQKEIQSRDCQLKPVSQEVTSMKQLCIEGIPSEYYVAMAKNRTGKNGLYLTREPFNGLRNVDIDDKGIVKETSFNMDNLEMEQGSLRNRRLVIEGNFRKAEGFSYRGVPLVGLLV